MKLKRNYLTSQEMLLLVDELKNEENAVAREILKVGIVYQLLVGTNKGNEDCNDYYDAYMKSDINFETDVKNYKDIDGLVKQEIGIRKAVTDFIKNFGEKFEEIDQTNIVNAMEQLKELVDKDAVQK